jgi:hypothetical protein
LKEKNVGRVTGMVYLGYYAGGELQTVQDFCIEGEVLW